MRVYDYLPHLYEMGWRCDVLPFPERLTVTSKLSYVSKALRIAHRADVVVLQKLILREEFLSLLKRVNNRLVFDFDDACYVPPDAAAHDPLTVSRCQLQKRRLHHIFCHVRSVIAGSQYLAQYASQFTPSVHVLPTSIDLVRYPIKPSGTNNAPVVLGWIGSSENLMDFATAHSPLRKALSRLNGQAVLKVVSTRPLTMDGVSAQFEPWKLDHDAEFLHGFDIGLMPLQDTERSRGRCGFKAIQYMAVGLPVLASRIGVATEVIVDGQTGLLLSREDEWLEAIERLVGDPSLRRRMGLAGRRRVEQLFSVEKNAEKLTTALLEIAHS